MNVCFVDCRDMAQNRITERAGSVTERTLVSDQYQGSHQKSVISKFLLKSQNSDIQLVSHATTPETHCVVK